jgi:hypothetical protein
MTTTQIGAKTSEPWPRHQFSDEEIVVLSKLIAYDRLVGAAGATGLLSHRIGAMTQNTGRPDKPILLVHTLRVSSQSMPRITGRPGF